MSHPKLQFFLTPHQESIIRSLFYLAEESDRLGNPGAVVAQIGYSHGAPTAHVTFVPGDKVNRINEILEEKEKPNEVSNTEKTSD
jgi:hypothetical protein